MVCVKAFLRRILFLFLCLWIYQQAHALSSYSKNDPYPVFTSLDPHLFLLQNEILEMTGKRPELTEPNRFSFSLSPFWQCADYGKTVKNLGCQFLECSVTGCSEVAEDRNWCTKQCAELGNIDGKWNLLTLLYGRLPECVTSFPPTLAEAKQKLFPNDQPGNINYPELIDPNQTFGFISFPGSYKKRGFRWEADVRLVDGFGIKLQSGISDICLNVSASYTCTSTPTCCESETLPTDFYTNVTQLLLCKYRQIACELGLDLNNFHECYLEDIWASLYWRKPYELTEHPDCPHHVIATPFFVIGGAFAVGKEKSPCRPFSLPFGNNGHHAVGTTAGIDFNFVESIEIGGEIGITHFFSRDIDCLHVPNSPYQSGIYPWTTNAKVSPGLNCHIGAKFGCYHFLDCLSFFCQYIYLSHQDDEIKIKNCDSAFCPKTLERFSPWKVQLANIGFNYDISSNLSLGILWQTPITESNAYHSTTVLFSLSAIF